jgi:hypothetical protein
MMRHFLYRAASDGGGARGITVADVQCEGYSPSVAHAGPDTHVVATSSSSPGDVRRSSDRPAK